MSPSVFVLSVGLACPLGLRARSALAAIRAGIRRYAEVDGEIDLTGEMVRASYLQSLDRGLSRMDRAHFFATQALADVLEQLQCELRIHVPVYVALPAQHARSVSASVSLAGVWSRMLTAALPTERCPAILTCDPSRFFFHGRAAIFWALRAAVDAIFHGDDFALLIAADSLVDRVTLGQWAQENRLLGKRNGDGAIPGEGAAALLLGSSRMRFGHRPLALVQETAVSEQAPFSSCAISSGLGITEVFRALQRATNGRVDEIVSAQPSQSMWPREFSYASLRCAELLPEPLKLVSLGSSLGDAGTAAGAMAIVEAVSRFRRPTSQGRKLAYALSDGGQVGGVVLAASQDGGGR